MKQLLIHKYKNPMKNETRKFLDFNGTNIPVLSADGNVYVAIKPICTALGVNYDRQYKNLLSHPIFSHVYAKQHTHDTINRVQEMICLPERYIYGWLLSINSSNEDLIKYQLECHDVLYNYFHGATTERLQLLKVKSEDEIALEELVKKVEEEKLGSENYQKMVALKAKIGGTKKGLKLNDVKLLEAQTKLFGE